MEFLEGESHRPNSIALRANRFSSFIGRENNNVSFDLLFRFDGVSNGNDVLGPTICKYCHFFKLLFLVLLFFRIVRFTFLPEWPLVVRRREIQLKSVLPVTIISHVRDSGSIADRRLLPCKHGKTDFPFLARISER